MNIESWNVIRLKQSTCVQHHLLVSDHAFLWDYGSYQSYISSLKVRAVVFGRHIEIVLITVAQLFQAMQPRAAELLLLLISNFHHHYKLN